LIQIVCHPPLLTAEVRGGGPASQGRERRQFANSHLELSRDAQELAEAIDAYKIRHRRRFIDYEEMLSVLRELGYERHLASD